MVTLPVVGKNTVICALIFRSYNLHLDVDGTEIPHCSARLLSTLVVGAQSHVYVFLVNALF